MNLQEPRHESPASEYLPVPGGLRGLLVIEGPSPLPHVFERAALLPLAPGARVTLLEPGGASTRSPSDSGGTWPPGSPRARLEARVRAAGGQLTGLSPAPEEELLPTVQQSTRRHGLELVLLPHEHDSLRTRLFGSLSEQLARHGVPVLVSRPPARRRYQRILVGTDFSLVSRAALELALRLAAPGGRLQVFHAYDTSYALTLRQTGASAGKLLAYYQQMHAQAEAAMRDFLMPYGGSEVALQPVLASGAPHAALHEVASKQDAELVVVGRNRAQGAGHALLGSVAETTLRRRARYDVLCVPGPTVH